MLLRRVSILAPAIAATYAATLTSLGTKNVIVQIFEWPWNSIASECTQTLGPAGYGYVQVSPPHEHVTGPYWYTDYQVVSYNLISKRGDRKAFANMASTCKKAGVGILVDLISNHMTIGTSTVTQKGFGGSPYSAYNYPAAGFTSSNFHYCNQGKPASITDFGNRYNVQFCEEGGLHDLAQEQGVVEDALVAYMNDLMSLGVFGFRVDSALEQPASNLTAMFHRLDSNWWATLEIGATPNFQVQEDEYWPLGATTMFDAMHELAAHFTGKGIANLVYPTPMSTSWNAAGGHSYPPAGFGNIFVSNHDCERGSYGTPVLTSASPNNAYTLAHLFILGFNYGIPTVYSAYDYSNRDANPPTDANGYVQQVTCYQNGWRCEHKWDAIRAMVGFHNVAGTANLVNAQLGTQQQIGERDI